MSSRHVVRVIVTGFLAAGFLAFVAACQKKTDQEGGKAASPAADPERAAMLDLGHRDYLAYCSMCHGEWGDGDGPLAGELRVRGGVTPARLSDRARLDSLGRTEVMKVIEKGGAHTGRSNLMPPWGERLARSSIREITEFVMTLPDLERKPSVAITQYLAAPPGSAPEGRTLYVQYCVPCHGPDGRGDGIYADTLVARNNIRPRDFTDSLYFARRSDQDLYLVIALGGAHAGKSQFMPVWNVTIPPDQIKDLVSYVRAVSRTAPRP